MKLWEMTDPDAKIVLHLRENRSDPMRALIETSLKYDIEVGRLVEIYKKYLAQ